MSFPPVLWARRPTFKVIVTLINTTAKPVSSLNLTFTGDSQMYKIETPLLRAAMLIPGTPYLFSTMVKCLTEELESSPITIIVFKPTDTGAFAHKLAFYTNQPAAPFKRV